LKSRDLSAWAMNNAREKLFFLTVRLGTCQRSTETDGNHVRRWIRLSGCPIISNSLKGEGQPAQGDEIELSVLEAEPREQVIGSFDTLGFLQLSLQPAAFAELWAASAAADGAARDIAIQFKSTEPPFYLITKASLFEHMPAAIDSNPKGHGLGYIPGRVHPVVEELRDIRRTVAGSWRGLAIWLFVVVGFVLVSGLISSTVRALWRLVQP
jgi:hypothetical protein